MIKFSIFCASIVVAALLIAMGAQARPGSLCASYHEGATACGYGTQDQCLDTMRGIGGICIPND
jgi:hypothetical protein